MKKVNTKQLASQRPAPDRLIREWAQVLCAPGDEPETRTSALLLLLDEIERGCFSYDRVEEVVWVARTSIFGTSDAADQTMREMVATLRSQKGLRLVKGGK